MMLDYLHKQQHLKKYYYHVDAMHEEGVYIPWQFK